MRPGTRWDRCKYGDQESSGGALAHGTAAAKTGGQEGSDEGEVRPEGGRRRVEEEV